MSLGGLSDYYYLDSGVYISALIEMFFATYSVTGGGLVLGAFPDGECYFNQDALLISYFKIIKDEYIQAVDRENNKPVMKRKSR